MTVLCLLPQTQQHSKHNNTVYAYFLSCTRIHLRSLDLCEVSQFFCSDWCYTCVCFSSHFDDARITKQTRPDRQLIQRQTRLRFLHGFSIALGCSRLRKEQHVRGRFWRYLHLAIDWGSWRASWLANVACEITISKALTLGEIVGGGRAWGLDMIIRIIQNDNTNNHHHNNNNNTNINILLLLIIRIPYHSIINASNYEYGY